MRVSSFQNGLVRTRSDFRFDFFILLFRNRHEAHLVARLDERRAFRLRREEAQRCAPDELPSAGAVYRIDARLLSGDADAAALDDGARICEARRRYAFVHSAEVGEAGQEAYHVAVARLRAVAFDDFLFRYARVLGDVRYVGAVLAAVADGDFYLRPGLSALRRRRGRGLRLFNDGLARRLRRVEVNCERPVGGQALHERYALLRPHVLRQRRHRVVRRAAYLVRKLHHYARLPGRKIFRFVYVYRQGNHPVYIDLNDLQQY